MNRATALLKEAGIPDGVFQILNGTANTVTALCDHPSGNIHVYVYIYIYICHSLLLSFRPLTLTLIRSITHSHLYTTHTVMAVSFVGSSKVAELVANRCRALNKRVLALGGAKNHLVALPDCDVDMAASDIVASFGGCAGQRCMAASVLLLVGDNEELVSKIIKIAGSAKAGTGKADCGAIIDAYSRDRIVKYINEAEAGGAKVLLDGRGWSTKEGYWVGPTVILHSNPNDAAMQDEIFGPVLSIYKVCAVCLYALFYVYIYIYIYIYICIDQYF
jgi:malonate-semialdehyde dehydrogenase (acetylating)/methylmalonate-semialdehyde dehydrogenase